MKTLRILGIRGIPAAHGGFETFAERLAPFLVRRGWRVIVYCQHPGGGRPWSDRWEGVDRVNVPVRARGALATIEFDLKSTLHAAAEKGLCLTLGYNTALFFFLLKLRRVTNVVNMDGIEWRRAKWGALAKAWFWINEKLGCFLGDVLIADHPEIKTHLAPAARGKRIEVIPYGGDDVDAASVREIAPFTLEAGQFATIIARAEPENSVLEIVSAFSRESRGLKLVVLGSYDEGNSYHRKVRAAASDEVMFLGAIYDKQVVAALRKYSRFYIHGHQVGGTNPSLVEALAAGNAVIAHDNVFNRWVAGSGAIYFRDETSCAERIKSLLSNSTMLEDMRSRSIERHSEEFTWERVLGAYERLLEGASECVESAAA